MVSRIRLHASRQESPENPHKFCFSIRGFAKICMSWRLWYPGVGVPALIVAGDEPSRMSLNGSVVNLLMRLSCGCVVSQPSYQAPSGNLEATIHLLLLKPILWMRFCQWPSIKTVESRKWWECSQPGRRLMVGFYVLFFCQPKLREPCILKK
jgi:hypothetical protein